MNYLDNDKKLVLVLNGKVGIPQLFNAGGHVIAGLATALHQDVLSIENYSNAAAGFSARVSRYPLIVLKAKNSSQLSTLRCDAETSGLPVNLFVSTMIGNSAAEQRERTFSATSEQLDYWAVAVFGAATVIDPLTRKFSLFNIHVGGPNGA